MSFPAIRRAMPDDTVALAALIERTILASNVADYDPAAIGSLLQAMAPVHIAERMVSRDCFVAVDDGVFVGTISLGGDRLHQMFVAPERQKGGLGRRLVAHLEGHARARGVADLRLHSSLTARGFYERLGYRMVSYQPQGVPTWLMIKRL